MQNSFNWPLARIVTATNAKLIGTAAIISRVSTDTRTIHQGDLFIALSGEHFDAHDFCVSAVQKGAAAVMVERQLPLPVPQIIVADTRKALGMLARAWREQFSIPCIAVTGSNGKTTVKEMMAAICAQRGSVLATQGNLNNDIGVPLTLLQITAQHQFAVIEMGANHRGEIAYLTALAKPDVALINNAGPAHLEGFGSIEGVAHAKGEIYSGLSSNGIGIVNADDHFTNVWRSLCKSYKMITFGLQQSADINATWHANNEGSALLIQTPQGKVNVQLHLLGKHNVMNALAATAATLAVGCSLDDVKHGLESMLAVKGRLQIKQGKSDSRIIDDTYNANPASFKAALDVMSVFPGSHYVALGDMGELGPDAETLHREVGNYAKVSGVKRLYTVGPYARYAAQEFGQEAMAFDTQQPMINAIETDLTAEVTLLVKGSRAMQMENVVMSLLKQSEG